MKRHFYIKKLLKNNAGFTLLEVICVVAIMGMMAAMVVPASAGVMRNARISATQTRLDDVKAAIIGARGAQANSAAGGFAGDTGRLPYLFGVIWNEAESRWDWDFEQTEAGGGTILKTVNDGTGQPAELWKAIPPAYASPEWAGPYLSFPRDPYPDDTKNLSPDFNNPADADWQIFSRKQVEGRLSDAWGRALYFWLEYPLMPDPDNPNIEYPDTGDKTGATLWIISAGPDGKAVFDAGGIYDENGKENRDNIVVKIMPRAWYWENNDIKTAETQATLSAIRSAVVGSGRGAPPSGYIGDMGTWPELYMWDAASGVWTVAPEGAPPADTFYSPRGLWVRPEDDSQAALWSGPYLDPPWGGAENELLVDAWGKPLHFERVAAGGGSAVSERLEIVSGGMDMDIGTPGDNITMTIHDYEWKKDGQNPEPRKKAEAKSLLEQVSAAFIGGGPARDAAGRVIMTGYLADTGALPDITDPATPDWLWEAPENPLPEGFSWNGPYYPKPENGEILDPWGNPLVFIRETIAGQEVLRVTSGGPDGAPDTGDEQELTIAPGDWQTEDFKIEGVILNPTRWEVVTTVVGLPDPEDEEGTITVMHVPDPDVVPSWEITFWLYALPGETPLEHTVPVSGLDGQVPFSVDIPACAVGKRILAVEQDGIEMARIILQIGAGGTHSPAADRLTVTIDPSAAQGGGNEGENP